MLYAAFILGLTGSLHCAGMCGPLSFAFTQGRGFAFRLFFYQAGRLAMYAVLGGLVATFGRQFIPVSLQGYIAIILGGLMLLTGLLGFNLDRLTNNVKGLHNLTIRLAKISGKFMAGPPPLLFVAGIFNGLIPCGLIWFALLWSMAAPTTFDGSLLMFAFGLGTLPALLMATWGLKKLQTRRQFNRLLRKAYPVAFVLLGLWFIRAGVLAWQSGGVLCG